MPRDYFLAAPKVAQKILSRSMYLSTILHKKFSHWDGIMLSPMVINILAYLVKTQKYNFNTFPCPIHFPKVINLFVLEISADNILSRDVNPRHLTNKIDFGTEKEIVFFLFDLLVMFLFESCFWTEQIGIHRPNEMFPGKKIT